jgi:uncharacterized protein (TIGR02466 family)|tara:strand:+ start:218 stop:832 length:615 start_codon:yes stop_codon:yes gene_type:complete
MRQEIFSTPIWIKQLPNHKKFKEQFFPYISEDKYFDTVDRWGSSSEATFDTDVNDKLPWNDLINEASEQVDIFLQCLEPMHPYRIGTDAWLNRYKKGNFQEVHNHCGEGNFFSAVYFLETPKNTGEFLFFDDSTDFYATMNFHKIFKHMFGSSFKVDVKEGDILIFPSHILHQVTQNPSDQIRATIAMNFTLAPLAQSQGENNG